MNKPAADEEKYNFALPLFEKMGAGFVRSGVAEVPNQNHAGERGYTLAATAGATYARKYYLGIYADNAGTSMSSGTRNGYYPLRCLAIE